MRTVVVVACGVACLASVAVAAGTASPVLYGVGEQTTGVSVTLIGSILTALLSGGGGLWAILKSSAPSLISVVRPVIGGTASKFDDAALSVVESLFGSRLDAATLTEEGAVLFVAFMRMRAGDAKGKDDAFALLEHVRQSAIKADKK